VDYHEIWGRGGSLVTEELFKCWNWPGTVDKGHLLLTY